MWIDSIGRFTLDDDEQLREMTFPKHILEYRNETLWEKSSQAERQATKNEGWHRVTPDELEGALASAGVIRWE